MQVKRAVALLWVSLALSVLDSILAWEPLDPPDPRWDVALWVLTGGVLLFAAALIYLIARRHNWARLSYLALSVLATLAYAAFPLDIFASEPWWSVALTVVITVLDLAALYWLFSGSGGRWYSTKVVA